MSRHKCRDDLAGCPRHPKWSVVKAGSRGGWAVFKPHGLHRVATLPTHAEAMNDATERARAEALAAVQSAEGVTAR